MHFKFSANHSETLLSSGHGDDRWSAISAHKAEETTGRRLMWFEDRITYRDDATLVLTLGLDRHVTRGDQPRLVVLRTSFYRRQDMRDTETVARRRRLLEAQLEMLNHLASPLLPEPLDWITIRNQVDALPVGTGENEPVLVVNWESGRTLRHLLECHRLRYRDRPTRADNDPTRSDLYRIARIGRQIVRYLNLLKNKGVICFDLNPEHILFGKDDVPRFLGLGRLCPVRDGTVDRGHPGFLRTTRGYCPPEVNDDRDDWYGARTSTPESVGAFALGVLLLQMICGQPCLPREWMHETTLAYPHPHNGEAVRLLEDQIPASRKGNQLITLISNLCEPDRDRRLKDLDDIDSILARFAGERGI